MRFLSTPSARRATGRAERTHHARAISIHALREEGDGNSWGDYSGVHISIHALREEGDLAYSAAWSALQISIHALREEGDV